MRRAEASREVAESAWTAMTKLVALVLLALADRNGIVGLSQAQLGARLGLSDRRIRSALAEMGADGLLVLSERGQFRVLFEPDPAEPRIRSATGSTGTTVPLVPLDPVAPVGVPRASRAVSDLSSLSDNSSEIQVSLKTDYVDPLGEVGSGEGNQTLGSDAKVFSLTPPKTSVVKRAARRVSKPELMRVDWEPPSGLVSALATQFDVPVERIRRQVPNVVWYWREGKGTGTRRSPAGWDTTFRNWVARIAKSGELYTEPSSVRPAGERRAPNRAEDTVQVALRRVAELEAEEARERA